MVFRSAALSVQRREHASLFSVKLGGLIGGAFDHITLSDVLYVPEASVNLVSVPLAVRRGIVFDFAEQKKSCYIVLSALSGTLCTFRAEGVTRATRAI